MKNKSIIYSIIVVLAIIAILIILSRFGFFKISEDLENAQTLDQENNITTNSNHQELIEPVIEMKDRITKKPFGIFVTPQNSPVSPERFNGYHTAIDVEFSDKPEQEIDVFSITKGTVIRSGYVNGYGGVILIQHKIAGMDYIGIYGHIRPSTLKPQDAEVKKAEKIGILGDGFTAETDGERKHLHFGILKGSSPDLRGYVKNQQELANWIDPLKLF